MEPTLSVLQRLRLERTKRLQRTWRELGNYRGNTVERDALRRHMKYDIADIRQMGEAIIALQEIEAVPTME